MSRYVILPIWKAGSLSRLH